GVLVVVDEDALAPLLLPPGRRDERRVAALDLAGERERGAADDAELPVRLDAAVDVDAAVAARLRPADVADLVEHLVDDRGDALLPDHLAADALGLPLQLAWPLVERAHDPVADREEVVHEVELRLTARRKVDLVRVRHLDGATADLELDER